MVFLVGMPMLIGFANYFVPLMIGARDMAFPRLNALSYWILLFGGLLLYFSFVTGGAPAVGWFGYAPLSEPPFSTGLGVDYWRPRSWCWASAPSPRRSTSWPPSFACARRG
jgi:heme/copper-type cytochrome/quinol oxidase subunit 1